MPKTEQEVFIMQGFRITPKLKKDFQKFCSENKTDPSKFLRDIVKQIVSGQSVQKSIEITNRRATQGYGL